MPCGSPWSVGTGASAQFNCPWEVAVDGEGNFINVVMWFMQADEHALEGLREITLRYLNRNLSKIRAEAKDTLAKLTVEKALLMAEVMMGV